MHGSSLQGQEPGYQWGRSKHLEGHFSLRSRLCKVKDQNSSVEASNLYIQISWNFKSNIPSVFICEFMRGNQNGDPHQHDFLQDV